MISKPKYLRKFIEIPRKLYALNNSSKLGMATEYAASQILLMYSRLNKSYRKLSKQSEIYLRQILNDLTPKDNIQLNIWEILSKWATRTNIFPDKAPLMGTILNSLCSSKILKAENAKKGTQLKLLLTLQGGKYALFKPQWYERQEIISGDVYAGKDRHNGEVAAFHLSILLNLRRVPLTVGRKLNLQREVYEVASTDLKNSFYKNGNNTCFYGSCFYCSKEDPVCAKGEIMEGAFIAWLPNELHFSKHVSPWQRTYKKNLAARWEMEKDYCDRLKHTKEFSLEAPDSKNRLLDLVDASIFDFLISNGDRHHYEVPVGAKPSSVFLFDNGKSFGDPHTDHLDILAPLYQCCVLRKDTWLQLLKFTGGFLSYSLNKTLSTSHIAPVLTEQHLKALDRRLLFVFATVEVCVQDHTTSNVFL